MTKRLRRLLLNLSYVFLVSLCLATAIHVRGGTLLWIGSILLFAVVCASSYHHLKSRSFSTDTVIEYTLTLALAIVVLLGALNH